MKKYNHEWLIAEWQRMGRPEIEYLYCDGDLPPVWMLSNSIIFYDDIQYRIKSKPYINWSHVHKDFIAMARDSSGECYLYVHKPPILDDSFDSWEEMQRNLGCASAERFSSFTQGTCDWKDSLVMRPVVVGEK